MKNSLSIQKSGKKRASIFIASFLSLAITCSAFALPPGDLRELSPFSQVDISGAYKVVLIQGDKEQVLVEADDETLPKIITKVEGGTLEIYSREKINSSSPMKVTITFKNINEIDCSGAVELSSQAPLKLSDLDVDLSGASKLNLDITASRVGVDISGAGTATITGTSKSVNLDISGSGKFNAAALTAEEYNVDISGAGSAKVNASSKLNVEISGSGSVSYSGDPKITKSISGAGSITKM